MNNLSIKLDKAFSQYIRNRGSCEKCGSRQNLECSHIFSRKFKSTRWDEKNCLCLCSNCHRQAHASPKEFKEFVISYLGEEIYQKLELKHNQIHRWNDFEIRKLIKRCK